MRILLFMMVLLFNFPASAILGNLKHEAEGPVDSPTSNEIMIAVGTIRPFDKRTVDGVVERARAKLQAKGYTISYEANVSVARLGTLLREKPYAAFIWVSHADSNGTTYGSPLSPVSSEIFRDIHPDTHTFGFWSCDGEKVISEIDIRYALKHHAGNDQVFYLSDKFNYFRSTQKVLSAIAENLPVFAGSARKPFSPEPEVTLLIEHSFVHPRVDKKGDRLIFVAEDKYVSLNGHWLGFLNDDMDITPLKDGLARVTPTGGQVQVFSVKKSYLSSIKNRLSIRPTHLGMGSTQYKLGRVWLIGDNGEKTVLNDSEIVVGTREKPMMQWNFPSLGCSAIDQ